MTRASEPGYLPTGGYRLRIFPCARLKPVPYYIQHPLLETSQIREEIMKKMLPLLILFGLLVVGAAESQVTSWTHVVKASEYTRTTKPDGKEYLVYTYYDERFNTEDWFATWIEDWAYKSGGWSEFEPTMDNNFVMYFYDATYNDGYVTWNAYTADLDLIVGVKLKFFHMKVR